MSNWFFGLPVFPAMTIIVFGITYAIAACLFLVVSRLNVGDRVKVFKAVVPSCLSPLGGVFALLLVFSAEPVWTNFNDAKKSVAAEASGLRDVLILARGLPGDAETHIRGMVSGYLTKSVNAEWPAMAANRITLETHNICGCSAELLAALDYTRGLNFQDDRQRTDQRDIIKALEDVRSKRRERIQISEDDVSTSRFTGLVVIGLCLAIWVGLVDADNRKALGIALTIFATVMAMATLLIVSYSSPFGSGNGVSPAILQEVMDGIPARTASTL